MKLSTVKQDLRIIHDDDDDLLRRYIWAANTEALQFCNRDDWDDVKHGDSEPHDVDQAMILLIRAMYDETDIAKVALYRQAAEAKLMPYRKCMGI